MYMCMCFFFFKQKTAYEMRISDWSSDVCSSDLAFSGSARGCHRQDQGARMVRAPAGAGSGFRMLPDAAKRARRPHFTVWGWLTRWVGGPEHRQTLGRPVRRGLGGRGRGRPELGELEGDECVDEHLRVEHGCGGDAGGEVLARLRSAEGRGGKEGGSTG